MNTFQNNNYLNAAIAYNNELQQTISNLMQENDKLKQYIYYLQNEVQKLNDKYNSDLSRQK